ncbi:MAG TPA: 4Fe-4S dicluster domain-containing protein [Candidatus Baltobacteraceae bacterium]|nr:4Fe-4S dicluster domain-containing protein [Candidatus Baltobacteraceae bacterium]
MTTFIDLTRLRALTSAEAEAATYGAQQQERMGFFTDTTLCIGCKACEVACKEWNELPQDGYNFTGMSYDNTGELGGYTWRHVAFIEQFDRTDGQAHPERKGRWLMESDVCKHCTHAGCLDVCPTGAIIRTEFGTVVIQEDVCNGCGYCVVACPFGVISEQTHEGTMGKCTLCYDRLKAGEEPACAKACPTESIQFGPVDELRERAGRRLKAVEQRFDGAQLYLTNKQDGIGGGGSMWLLLDKPEVYGLPPDPIVPTKYLPQMWQAASIAMGMLAGAVIFATVAGARR